MICSYAKYALHQLAESLICIDLTAFHIGQATISQVFLMETGKSCPVFLGGKGGSHPTLDKREHQVTVLLPSVYTWGEKKEKEKKEKKKIVVDC